MATIRRVLADMLKVNDPEKRSVEAYSLSRVVLLSSVILYFICLICLLIFMFIQPPFNESYVSLVLDALRWPILTFAAYSFGGKYLKSENPDIPKELNYEEK